MDLLIQLLSLLDFTKSLVLSIFMVVLAVLWALILLDCILRDVSEFDGTITKSGEYDKLFWILFIALTPQFFCLGGLAYLGKFFLFGGTVVSQTVRTISIGLAVLFLFVTIVSAYFWLFTDLPSEWARERINYRTGVVPQVRYGFPPN